MKKYKMEIKETLQKIIEISADSLEEAKEKVEEMYRKEEVILYPDNHIDTTIDEYNDDFVPSLDDVIKRIADFNRDRNWDQFHTPANLAKSISIEASELLECFQWSDEIQDMDCVKEELADIMNYCIQMTMVLEANITKIINDKIDKNEVKYPVSKCIGISTKYTKL